MRLLLSDPFSGAALIIGREVILKGSRGGKNAFLRSGGGHLEIGLLLFLTRNLVVAATATLPQPNKSSNSTAAAAAFFCNCCCRKPVACLSSKW